MIAFYNEQLGKTEPSMDATKISWTRGLKKEWLKGTILSHKPESIQVGLYRPFVKSQVYSERSIIEYPAIRERFFPTLQHQNLAICVNMVGGRLDFSTIITDHLPDLHIMSDGCQCFPLYWYEENKSVQTQNLFGEESSERWTQRDGITDWFLTEVRSRFSGAKNLTKEDVFYYVYGLLHSPDYRERFADDLRKALPNIPIVEQVDDFMAFSKAGRALADLHLSYEDHAHKAGVIVSEMHDVDSKDTERNFEYYRVEKMRFPSNAQKGDTIIYNSNIMIQNIPAEAYDYIVNGKSAIEWIMERYAVTTDKKSGIKNAPNLWSLEQEQPRYILDLLLSIIHVSLETQKIVGTLPKLTFCNGEQ